MECEDPTTYATLIQDFIKVQQELYKEHHITLLQERDKKHHEMTPADIEHCESYFERLPTPRWLVDIPILHQLISDFHLTVEA
jgi:hypothetical protein